MKKFFSIVASVAISYSVFAASSSSVTLPTATITNLLGNSAGAAGSLKITQIVVTSPANNTATIAIYDTWTNILTYSNSAYSTVSSYATNLITSWTNFFGATNYMTNIALIDYSNYVAAATNTLSPLVTVTVPTNQTLILSEQSYYFNKGAFATNLATGTATISVNYVKP